MKVVYIILVAFAIFAMIPFFYDNTDNSIWTEKTKDHTFLVSSSKRLLLQSGEDIIKQLLQAEEEERVLKLQSLFSDNKNLCLNGKDPKKWTYQQILNEYINGPCAPIILVPGLAGTSLEVQIDCEVLQSQSPEIFESCGWQTCNSWYIWYSKPDSEYRLWISTTTSTVGVIQTSPKDHCFGNLMELKYDFNTKKHINTPGLNITYYGNTPKTQKYNECGLGGIKEMTDDYIIKYMMCDYKGFQNIGELLKNMGYISGLTFQAIPYDYRIGIQQSEAQSYIKNSIQNLYQLTGKKVIILTHSLGSLHTLNVLGQMTKEEKQEQIFTVMTMGAPYLGSSKAVRAHLGGDPSFLDTFLGMTVGINYHNQNKVINSASSQVDIYPKTTFFNYLNEPWMQEILNRISQEKQYLENKQNNVTAISWFPNPQEICSNITDSHHECLMNLQDLKDYFVEIDSKQFTIQQIDELLQNYTINSTLIKDFYENQQSETLNTLKNPEVPFIILYGGFAQTEYQFKYQQNPLSEVLKNQDFYFPNTTTFAIGDQTVLTSSALTPAIKWIYEHQNNITSNPIKVIQYCSNYKGALQQQLYDSEIEGQKYFQNSGYVGLECECLKKGASISDCKHSCLINDKFVVEMVSILVKNNQKSNISKTPLNKDQIEKIIKDCPNLQI